MPPRSHSSSSRSSSSSHSSSSRSSSSSSRSYSSSSSSRSSSSSSRSYSGSSSSRSSSSYSRGPSSHSSSSRYSTPKPSTGYSAPGPSRQSPYRSAPPPQPRRPRHNQPLGYLFSGALAPKYYYGTRHDYVYYPDSWTDTSTGTYYEKGYYDENGQRYDDVSFAQNGKYENVLCHCDYCGRDTLLNLDATDALTDLKCPGCTAPLTIKSALDEVVTQASSSYTPPQYMQTPSMPVRKKKRKWPWILAIFLFLFGLGEYQIAKDEANQPQVDPVQQIQYNYNNSSIGLGTEISLERSGADSYRYSAAGSADKTLVWDVDADSYYDADSDCWLWYNEDVDPAVWQYWYEGISSDYEESGWMEHYTDGWFIEASPGNWIPLPDSYDSSGLWYIDELGAP